MAYRLCTQGALAQDKALRNQAMTDPYLAPRLPRTVLLRRELQSDHYLGGRVWILCRVEEVEIMLFPNGSPMPGCPNAQFAECFLAFGIENIIAGSVEGWCAQIALLIGSRYLDNSSSIHLKMLPQVQVLQTVLGSRLSILLATMMLLERFQILKNDRKVQNTGLTLLLVVGEKLDYATRAYQIRILCLIFHIFRRPVIPSILVPDQTTQVQISICLQYQACHLQGTTNCRR